MLKFVEKLEIYIIELDRTKYSRVNGEWRVNTGGSPMNWLPLKEYDKSRSIYYEDIRLTPEIMEELFRSLIRDKKLELIGI
jgi:hypothetical protein